MSEKSQTIRKLFIKTFHEIDRGGNRFNVFRDFVYITAFSIHNSIAMDKNLEAEYMQIVAKYSKEDIDKLVQLFSMLIKLLDPQPSDVLGELFTDLELVNKKSGQFFTPFHISELMAEITFDEEIMKDKGYITASDPACGGGSMALALIKLLLKKKYNPLHCVWFHCQDIDRLCSLMCFIQLSLWNVPAQIVVGDSLKMEQREVFYTPAHYLGSWHYRLKDTKVFKEIEDVQKSAIVPKVPEQFGFDF